MTENNTPITTTKNDDWEMEASFSFFATEDGEVFGGGGCYMKDEFIDEVCGLLRTALRNLLDENINRTMSLVVDTEDFKGLFYDTPQPTITEMKNMSENDSSITTVKYPDWTEEQWSNWVNNSRLDCGDPPVCPMKLDNEDGCFCGLMLIQDFEGETSHSELCGRIGIMRQMLYYSSQSMIRDDKDTPGCGTCIHLWDEDACLGTVDGSACLKWEHNNSIKVDEKR